MPASQLNRDDIREHISRCLPPPHRTTHTNPMHVQEPKTDLRDLTIAPLTERDLPVADRIFRLAFGTFIGLPDPTAFGGDSDYVRTRFHAEPSAAFAAYIGHELVGSNFATNWGSVGFFGPLTVRPDLWNRSVGKRLMEPVMACFERWAVTHAGLFTFAQSQKHIGLYQRFGFWPRFLTPVMSKPVDRAELSSVEWTKLSDLPLSDRDRTLADCRALTDAVYAGLDVSSDIRSVVTQRLGDIVLLHRNSQLSAFAVCYCGAGTEAGTGTCYVKFGAARPSQTAAADFDMLLAACEAFTVEQGAPRLAAGVNTARHEAYTRLLTRGFRTDMQGVAMQRPNEDGYNRPGIYVLDDWR
jgi:GNAT superfamily N-acetyltransferase